MMSIAGKKRSLMTAAFGVAVFADLGLNSGDAGAWLLNQTDFTRPAVAYYDGFGNGMDIVRESAVEFGSELNNIVQTHYRK